MFPTNHQVLHKARQRDLEAAAEHHRRVSFLAKMDGVSPLRQHIGSLLIGLGQKVAQESQQEIHLVLSARR
jgi:hypothetical protein